MHMKSDLAAGQALPPPPAPTPAQAHCSALQAQHTPTSSATVGTQQSGHRVNQLTLEHSQRGQEHGQGQALPPTHCRVGCVPVQSRARVEQCNCGGFGLFGPSLVDTRFDAARRATLTFYLIFRLAAFLHVTSREKENEEEKMADEEDEEEEE